MKEREIRARGKSVSCILYLQKGINAADAFPLDTLRVARNDDFIQAHKSLTAPQEKCACERVYAREKSCINNCGRKTQRRHCLPFSGRGKIMILLERCSFFFRIYILSADKPGEIYPLNSPASSRELFNFPKETWNLFSSL